MKFIGTIIQRPAWTISFWMLIAAIGVISYYFMPIDLFPDTMPPQVVAMTVVRGASADDVNRRVTTLIDRELKGLTGIKKVVSTSRDEVSSVNAQFEYGTNHASAMTDVINAVNRVSRMFPAGAQSPQFFRITDANRPVITLALRPASGSALDLKAIRILAENDIKENLLRLSGVGKVDVFGANEPEVLVRMDIEKLRQFHIAPSLILKAIGAQNTSLPGGYLESDGRESLVKTLNEARTPEQLAALPMRVQQGGIISLGDVASVSLSVKTPRSIYHGNGEPAIAINILKPENGFAVDGINSVKKYLPELKNRFPEIQFEITTDQEPIITVNVVGMKDALFSAVWLTMLIVLLLLQNLRAAAIVGISIPLSFLSAFAFLYFTPFTINMVTLSGLIIAVGMVVDASIVVVENVYRHLETDGHTVEGVIKGTEEVVFSVWGGMLTTVVVMIPIMFVGGYAQQVLRPLTMTISATLLGSFVAAVTIIPILLKKWFADAETENPAKTVTDPVSTRQPGFIYRMVDAILDATTGIYLSLLNIGLKIRFPLLIVSLIFLAISARVVLPLVGRELMPRMDTGMIIIKADLPPSMTVDEVEKSISKIEKIINSNKHVLSISTVAGSEPGQVSFGAGGLLLQQIDMQVRLTTRDKRSETIWEIMGDWRRQFALIPELVSFSVVEFGATPMATTRAPLDVMISGRDPEVLYHLAEGIDTQLRQIKGLQDLRFSWSRSKPETHFVPDLNIASRYQLSPVEIGEFLGLTLTGRVPAALKMQGFVDLSVRAEIGVDGQRWHQAIGDLAIPGAAGDLFLSSLGQSRPILQPTLVTRENLQETIDILGLNSIRPLSAVAAEVNDVLQKFKLPAGYKAELTGSMADMTETGIRLGKALAIGFIMLYIVLYLLFESWWRPVLVMATIPLSLIGALWGLLVFDKPMCMPAMMGIILLGGTIVNNAIILIDFIDTAVKNGMPRRQALEESVKTRLRPILITTLSTVLGLMPLTFESAVGLERMSPLGVVASFGLLFGTIMTMVMIPVLYDLIMSIAEKFVKSSMTKSAALVIFLLLPMVAGASTQELTVDECLTTALASAPALLIAQSETELADGQKILSESALNPTMKLTAAVRHWDQKRPGVLGAIPGASQFYDENLSEVQLQLRQLIWDSGRSQAGLTAARKEVDARRQLQDRIKQETIFAVLTACIEVINQQALLEAVSKNVQDIEAALERIRKMKEVGRVAHVDVLRVEVREQEILAQQESALQGQTAMLAKLARICGMAEPPVRVASQGLEIFSLIEGSSDEELIAIALQSRQDLNAGRLRVAGARASSRVAERGQRPALHAIVAGNNYGNDNGRTINNGFAGLELSWQFFDGGATRGRKRQADASVSKASQVLAEAELRVAEQVRVSSSAVRSASARLQRSRKGLGLAEEAYRIQVLNYEYGKGTVNDLLDAQAALFNARAQLIKDENDLTAARIALTLAIGHLSR